MTGLKPAIFVDKDGTLVENVPYNVNPELLQFRPGALQAMADLAQQGYELVVVTNQSGVARGYFSEAELLVLRDALARRLREEAGVQLRGFQFCPHQASPDGAPVCVCRKPLPGMIEEAGDLYDIDLARSWMIGDTLDDVEAGSGAGCRTILYDSGGETVWKPGPGRAPSARCTAWEEVVRIILEPA